MKKVLLNGTTVNVDERFKDFNIDQKPSSNVAYFGTKLSAKELFVQFKNGSSYIYHDVDEETMVNSHTAESIGKFISNEVSKKFQCVKFSELIVTAYLEPVI